MRSKIGFGKCTPISFTGITRRIRSSRNIRQNPFIKFKNDHVLERHHFLERVSLSFESFISFCTPNGRHSETSKLGWVQKSIAYSFAPPSLGTKEKRKAQQHTIESAHFVETRKLVPSIPSYDGQFAWQLPTALQGWLLPQSPQGCSVRGAPTNFPWNIRHRVPFHFIANLSVKKMTSAFFFSLKESILWRVRGRHICIEIRLTIKLVNPESNKISLSSETRNSLIQFGHVIP